MGDQYNSFQIGVLVFFACVLLFAVAVFAGWIPIGRSADTEFMGSVTVWGPWPSSQVSELIHVINSQNDNLVKINYVGKTGSKLEQDYVRERIQGRGPDLIIINDTWLGRYRDTFWILPYSSFSERDFRTTYADGFDIFLTEEGSLARPLLVDPLVMFYNRDIYNQSGVAGPPATWVELIDGPAGAESVLKRLNIIEDRLTVKQSAVAMGQYSNITNAKDVVVSLLLQVGDRLVTGSTNREADSRGRAALEFYSRFANTNRFEYSWNRTLPNDKQMFLSGNLANYFGFASELDSLRRGNPNLNMDVHFFPQNSSATIKATAGRFYAVAVNLNSVNPQAAFKAAGILASDRYSNLWEEAIGLPSAGRSRLGQGHSNPFMSVFYRSALLARTWLDPDPHTTNGVFQNMIETVAAGGQSAEAALETARRQISNLFD
ncbi:MAG: extracellular solute-binding protein [Patescibacteria group bacterium]